MQCHNNFIISSINTQCAYLLNKYLSGSSWREIKTAQTRCMCTQCSSRMQSRVSLEGLFTYIENRNMTSWRVKNKYINTLFKSSLWSGTYIRKYNIMLLGILCSVCSCKTPFDVQGARVAMSTTRVVAYNN